MTPNMNCKSKTTEIVFYIYQVPFFFLTEEDGFKNSDDELLNVSSHVFSIN